MAKVEFNKYMRAEVEELGKALENHRTVNKGKSPKQISVNQAQSRLVNAVNAYINKIATAMQQNTIISDPTGIIMGKSTYGKEVDEIALAWHEQCVANTPDGQRPLSMQLRDIQHKASIAGEDTGPWKKIVYFFSTGVSVVYEKGKNAIVWCYKGITRIVMWAWDVIKKVSSWMWRQVVGAKNFLLNIGSKMINAIKSWFSKKPALQNGQVEAPTQPLVIDADPIVPTPA